MCDMNNERVGRSVERCFWLVKVRPVVFTLESMVQIGATFQEVDVRPKSSFGRTNTGKSIMARTSSAPNQQNPDNLYIQQVIHDDNGNSFIFCQSKRRFFEATKIRTEKIFARIRCRESEISGYHYDSSELTTLAQSLFQWRRCDII